MCLLRLASYLRDAISAIYGMLKKKKHLTPRPFPTTTTTTTTITFTIAALVLPYISYCHDIRLCTSFNSLNRFLMLTFQNYTPQPPLTANKISFHNNTFCAASRNSFFLGGNRLQENRQHADNGPASACACSSIGLSKCVCADQRTFRCVVLQ